MTGLVGAAVAVSMHELGDDIQLKDVQDQLDDISMIVLERVQTNDLRARQAHLHAVLFDELGFGGSTDNDTMDDPALSYLPVVLQTRRGLPITLSLVYKAVADRVGVPAWGIAAPTHFLIGTEVPGSPSIIVDPFHNGRVLTPTEVFRQIEAHVNQPIVPRPDLLQPTTNEAWLGRLLRNLHLLFMRTGHTHHLAAMLELSDLLGSPA